MSAVNRSSGRKKGTKGAGSAPSSSMKNQVAKQEVVKITDKEKKLTADQINIASPDASSTNDIDPNKIKTVVEYTQKTEEEALAALIEYGQDEQRAINALVDTDARFGWSTKGRKKNKKPANAGNAEAVTENHNDESETFETWGDNKDSSGAPPRTHGFLRNNGAGGVRSRRRDVNNRSDGRNRQWYGKENDRSYEGGSGYDRNNRDGGPDGERGGESRDYRGGRGGRRLMNGPLRGRGGRGARGGGRGQRTFQNNKDRGFFNQIDTWANPETTNNNNTNKSDEFPSADDWDNEEYTGSLAVTQVFTPSTQPEVEPSASPPPPSASMVIQSATFISENVTVEIKSKDDQQQQQPVILPITMQPTQSPIMNSSMASIVAGNNQLTSAQTQYLKQLTAQVSENRKQPPGISQQQLQQTTTQPHQQSFQQQSSSSSQQQQPSSAPLVSQVVQQQKVAPGQQQASSMIYNSSVNIPSQSYSPAGTPQISQPFPVIPQSTFLPNVSLPQSTESFSSITISSQTFSPSSNNAVFQPSPPISAASTYNGRTVEFTSANYSDLVNNYNAAHGLQNAANLSSRAKPQRPQSNASNKVSSGQTNDTEISSADPSSVNAAMKLLDVQFGALEFANSENYDNTSANVPDTTGSSGGGISSLSNKYSGAATIGQPPSSHADMSVNTFQPTSAQQQKHAHPSNAGAGSGAAGMQSVLVPNKQLSVNEPVLSADNVYAGQTIPSSRSPTIQELKTNQEMSSLSYGSLSADTSSYQNTQQSPAFQKTPSASSSTYHQSSVPVSTYTTLAYGPSQVTTTSSMYTSQHHPNSNNLAQFSVYGNMNSNNAITTQSATVAPVTTPIQQQQSYHHPAAVAPTTLQSFYSYPSSIMPPYQVSAGGLTQAPPYLGTQYGGHSLTNLGTVSYGATPFHSNYSMTTPVATVPQTGKITSSSLSSTSVSGKESQYDNVITPSSTTVTVPSTGASIPSATSVTSSVASLNLSQTTTIGSTASTTSSTKVSTTATTTTGSKTSSGLLPGIPAGMAPLVGPQYIMSQGTMPLYSPTFINYDDLQYMRGLHPHMTAGYLDMNYPGPQTNLPTPGRDGLTVPFSTISDARFSRPDNTTSPVPPGGAASLTQQNTGPAHQQPLINPGLLQTYAAAAYIYPYHQQYTAPVYQVAPTPTAGGHNSSNSALTGGPPFPKGPASYNSAGYPSQQYDSLGGAGNQNNLQDYATGKVSNSTVAGGGYSGSQTGTSGSAKGSGNSGSGGVAAQTVNAANSAADLSVNMYSNKSHGGLSKVFHAAATVPPPFTLAGGGSGSSVSALGNGPPNANTGPYGSPLYLSGPPNAAPHHLHQATHHQDNNDFRTSNMYPRSNYR